MCSLLECWPRLLPVSGYVVRAGDSVSLYAALQPVLRGAKLDAVPDQTVFLGNGVACMSRNDIFSSAQGLAVKNSEGVYSCPALHDLHTDWLFAQHLPSAVPAHVLAPSAQDRVLDMCAAPGGKTTQISTLMGNWGSVVALERSKGRCQALNANLTRWGVENVTVHTLDATKASRVFPPASFTKILLDAPCSGLGQRPQLQPGKRTDITECASYQQKLLREAALLLAPNGRLVYSTCTVSSQGESHTENEDNVVWALDNLHLELEQQQPWLGRPWGPEGACQLFDPSEWDLGFFLASFRRL